MLSTNAMMSYSDDAYFNMNELCLPVQAVTRHASQRWKLDNMQLLAGKDQ